jgi:hypothetical protein
MRDKYKPSEKEIEMFRRMTSGKSKKELLKMLKKMRFTHIGLLSDRRWENERAR